MRKRWTPFVLLLSALLALTGCAAKGAQDTPMAAMDFSGAEMPAMEAASSNSMAYSVASAPAGAAGTASGAAASGDFDVRKIIYNADLHVTADDPAAALQTLVEKATALGGYVSGSNTNNDDDGARRCNATIKVPADRLSELVEAAKATGKVDSYQLYSDDISQSYYDILARLNSAQSEEKALLEILNKCTTVEEVLQVRESLASVRADIESYQGQINLWDNLVDYATLEFYAERTPRTAVEGENDFIELWKASDVWKRMSNGFVNSARFVVNAVGAIGIFLAVAAIPAGILFLCIGLPLILRSKKKRKRKALEAEAAAKGANAEVAKGAAQGAEEPDGSLEKKEQ